MEVFWVVTLLDLQVDNTVSEEHAASIFGPEDGGLVGCNSVWTCRQTSIGEIYCLHLQGGT
jgi:hypothetical protein